MGHPAGGPVNFDSPSAAAALGALGITDLGLDNVGQGAPGRNDEDDRLKRLAQVQAVLEVRTRPPSRMPRDAAVVGR